MAAMFITYADPIYDPEVMNHSEVELFDPRERQAEIQASRDADPRALHKGELPLAQLHRRNGLLAFPEGASERRLRGIPRTPALRSPISRPMFCDAWLS